MNTLTQTVLKLQSTKDAELRDALFTEVYYGVESTIEKVVARFKYTFRGDAQAGYSVAYEYLMKAVEEFKYEGYEFKSFFSNVLRCKMIDLQRKIEADKMKHNTCYDVSLSETNEDKDGSEYGVEDRIADASLKVADTYDVEDMSNVSNMLDVFHTVKPAEAEVIEILIQYSAEGFQKKDLTDALAKYYGQEKYNGTIQKRVSRCREAFKKFATEEYGMDFNF